MQIPETISTFSSGMNPLAWLTVIFLGLGLAASCGLNTFLPLLMLASAAKFHLFGVQLNGSFAWLGSDVALAVLALATVAEMAADKIPTVDHALDMVGTVARPAAGALAAASVLHGSDPATAAVLGLIIGAPAAFGFHAAKAGTRAASTATTLGIANPLLSVAEDTIAIILVLVSLLTPLLVPVILLIALFAIAALVKAIHKRQPARAGQSAA